MSTRVTLSRDYPHGVPAFAAALADPEFHRIKLDVDGAARIELDDFRHEPRDDGGADVTLTLRQPVPGGMVPSVLTPLVDGLLVLERTERWSLADDHCRGTTEVIVPGTPIAADGTMSVAPTGPDGDAARLEVDLGVTVSVPLFGGGIEQAVLVGIRRLTGSEHERISAWLERHAGTGR